MAEGIVSTVVGSILEVLGSHLLQEVQLASSVQEEIRRLKDTVETINSVLLDAAEQVNQKKGHAVTGWLRRLKDAVYDTDDLLDEFYTQLKLKEMMNGNKMIKEVRIFLSKSNQIAYSLKMGHKIKTIRERLDVIKNDKQFLLFNRDNGKGVNYYHREREQTHSFALEENVIGREDYKNAILQLLLDSNDYGENNLSVISIVGIGGIGKTTLVQSVYNVEKVKTHFQLRMWVCVSEDFTLKTVVEKILKSATRKEVEKLEMDQLQEFLHEQIDGKKYLLVLDDVWNGDRNKWLQLHTLLENGAKGSKILVTTRMSEVAKIMTGHPLIFFLKGLSEDQSWSLFTKIAFENGKEPKDSSLVEIGKNIIAKCVGVPLAIKTIGNLLYGKGKEFWVSFRDQELYEIPQKEDDILPILKLSYDHLSSQLKQCFAYCALFPKDYEFEKKNLIQLWMAQGFLGTSKKNRCLEDVGNEYFMDLLSGLFLQYEESGLGRVITCKMHDLMHDLAQSVTGSEIKMITTYADSVDERCRHISFAPYLMSLNISAAILKVNHLRTFLPMCSYGELKKSDFHKIISNFRCLHTLNLCDMRIKKVPTSVGKLKLLRYLNLSRNWDIEELPNSISKLINLQILDLSGCGNLKNLPSDMRKMVSLQYLMIDGCDSLTRMPRGLGQMIDLLTLPLFVVGKREGKYDALRELNRLDKLRGSLRIRIFGAKENVNLAEANLKEKQYLESIRLQGYRNHEVMVKGLKPHPKLKALSIECLGSVMFSGCMSSFTNLTKLKISDSYSCQSITPLDQLPSLRLLTFESLENLEYISESYRARNCTTSTPAAVTTFFPSLKELTIVYCENLKGWWKTKGDEDDQVTTEKAQLISFPRLSKLHIYDCPMLTCMPLYPTLEELNLLRTSPKPLQQTMKMKMKTSADADVATPSTSYSTSFNPALSDLKSLYLNDILNDLESILELLQRNTSLVKMDIKVGPRLRDQRIIYSLTAEELIISGDDLLDLLNADDDKLCQWLGLRSIHYLEFRQIETMASLPKWIHLLANLKSLEISVCINLKSLPEGMQLEQLVIYYCPHLSERCGNKGVDWPKIAHIPNILIDLKWIQLEGCYREEILDELRSASSPSVDYTTPPATNSVRNHQTRPDSVLSKLKNRIQKLGQLLIHRERRKKRSKISN